MIEIDLSQCRVKPFVHQVTGIKSLVEHPVFFLADEMGAGKSLQAIVAAQILFLHGIIENVIVIAPASVRGVWFDPELGELKKHLFPDIHAVIQEYHARTHGWEQPGEGKPFHWLITNFEFIRASSRLDKLLLFCTSKTLLILDESSAIKNPKAEQTKACLQLRRLCGRVVLLNGTPIANSPMDMFSQGLVMDPRIVGLRSWFQYRSKYAIMGGWQQKQIVGWQNLDDLQRRFKPYVLRRLKRDCLDLPPTMPPVTLSVPLSETTWKVYKMMRDEMVVWLSESTVAVTQQAVVKSLRLAQITSGFIGGLESPNDEPLIEPGLLESLDLPQSKGMPVHINRSVIPQPAIQELSREKLDFVLKWFRDRLIEDPNLKLLVWCRFRFELSRMIAAVASNNGLAIGHIFGGQTKAERDTALRLLDPRTAPRGPVFFAGTYGTGSLGLNLSACHTVVNMSYDYSLFKALQAAARVDRPGQVHAVSYFDIVATGPQGQKTLDHAIIKAKRQKEDVSVWTTKAWIKALTEE